MLTNLLETAENATEAVWNSQAWATVIAAIISVVVSLIISVISGVITAQKAKMNFYSSTVSKERVEWINETRKITAELVAFCSVHVEDTLLPEDLFVFEKLRNSLLLRLSPKTYVETKKRYVETDGKLIGYLSAEHYGDVRVYKNEIREIVTVICKNEWNRIKAEAGGNKNVECKIKKYDASVEAAKSKLK